MGILIKDMEKPKSCYAVIDGELKHCPFVDAYDDCVILRKKGIWTGQTWEEQYSKCPLVEVPEPHGRLIDADKWLKEYDKKHIGPPGGARKLMEEAPTVIEAEANDEN